MKKLFWVIGLVIVFFIGDRIGGAALRHICEKSLFRYSRLYNERAEAEVLLLGNSRGLAFFEPVITQKTGKKTFNLSYNGLPAEAARVLTRDYIDRYPDVRKLVIDITLLDRVNDELLGAFLPYAAYSKGFDTLIRRKLPEMWWCARISHLSKYNNEIFQRAFYHYQRSDADWLLDRVISPDLAQKVEDNGYDIEPGAHIIEEFRLTVEYARSKGIEVRLVVGPYFPGFKVRGLDELKQAVEKSTGLVVADFQNALTQKDLFGDFMHVNRRGSEEYIDALIGKGIL